MGAHSCCASRPSRQSMLPSEESTKETLIAFLFCSSHCATHPNLPFPHPHGTGRPETRAAREVFEVIGDAARPRPHRPTTTAMKVNEAFSLLGLSPSPPPDEGAMRGAFKELALPFLALGEGDSLRHTHLWELCEAYEVRVKHRGLPHADIFVLRAVL